MRKFIRARMRNRAYRYARKNQVKTINVFRKMWEKYKEKHGRKLRVRRNKKATKKYSW